MRWVDPASGTSLTQSSVVAGRTDAPFNNRLTSTFGTFQEPLLAYSDHGRLYIAAAYDCVVLLTLAAERAGGTDGERMMEVLPGITRDGRECRSYRVCSALIRSGIDYVGESGPLDLNEAGDITRATYAIHTLGAETVLRDVDLRRER